MCLSNFWYSINLKKSIYCPTIDILKLEACSFQFNKIIWKCKKAAYNMLSHEIYRYKIVMGKINWKCSLVLHTMLLSLSHGEQHLISHLLSHCQKKQSYFAHVFKWFYAITQVTLSAHCTVFFLCGSMLLVADLCSHPVFSSILPISEVGLEMTATN